VSFLVAVVGTWLSRYDSPSFAGELDVRKAVLRVLK
jgi:hypothetical protein